MHHVVAVTLISTIERGHGHADQQTYTRAYQREARPPDGVTTPPIAITAFDNKPTHHLAHLQLPVAKHRDSGSISAPPQSPGARS